LFQESGCLLENLLLQMDNCYRENKNKYLMAFAAFLVEEQIFKEVILRRKFNWCKLADEGNLPSLF